MGQDVFIENLKRMLTGHIFIVIWKGVGSPQMDGKMQRKDRRRRVIIWENIANP